MIVDHDAGVADLAVLGALGLDELEMVGKGEGGRRTWQSAQIME